MNVVNISTAQIWCHLLCPKLLNSSHKLCLIDRFDSFAKVSLQLSPDHFNWVEVRTFCGGGGFHQRTSHTFFVPAFWIISCQLNNAFVCRDNIIEGISCMQQFLTKFKSLLFILFPDHLAVSGFCAHPVQFVDHYPLNCRFANKSSTELS